MSSSTVEAFGLVEQPLERAFRYPHSALRDRHDTSVPTFPTGVLGNSKKSIVASCGKAQNVPALFYRSATDWIIWPKTPISCSI
jgi:hypothetical protein